ncbi:unnamed protein product [Effrenium voratum]|uniref:Uncharacterized protein n=1 Tax=Effrenium voratum TaxID=2562239 RepID=A0AA36IFD2_9DINO|nr:unnamed protein product [Effrenium voratum]
MRLTLAPSFGARPAGCQVALRVSCRRAIASEADTWMHQLSTRFRSLTLIASATYLARSDFWRCASRPWTKDSRAAAQRLPHTLAQELLTAQQPTVAFVETRYVEEFTKLIGTRATVPFVLVTAGSDAPMTRTWQTRLLRMPGLRACYATNLHTPLDAHKDVFHPLPVGFYSMRLNAQNEALLQGQFASDRDCRLLVPWMRMKNGQKMRRGYWTNVLESEEYKDLVVLMKDRLAFPQYVEKLARGTASCCRPLGKASTAPAPGKLWLWAPCPWLPRARPLTLASTTRRVSGASREPRSSQPRPWRKFCGVLPRWISAS